MGVAGAEKPHLKVKASHPKLAVAGMNAGTNGNVGIVAAEKPEIEVTASHPKLGVAAMNKEPTNHQAEKVAKKAVDGTAEKPASESDDKKLSAEGEKLLDDYIERRKGYADPNVVHSEDHDGDCKPKGPNTQTSIHKCHKSLTKPDSKDVKPPAGHKHKNHSLHKEKNEKAEADKKDKKKEEPAKEAKKEKNEVHSKPASEDSSHAPVTAPAVPKPTGMSPKPLPTLGNKKPSQ